MKDIYNKIKYLLNLKIFKDNIFIIFVFSSFFVLDIALRSYTKTINFYSLFRLTPTLFTLYWIIFIISLIYLFRSKIARFIYVISLTLATTLFITNSLYFNYFKNYFDFKSLSYAGEANEYLMDVLKNCPPWVIIITIITIILGILGFRLIPKKETTNYKFIPVIVLIFTIGHLIIPHTLGKSVTTWDAWRKPRNVYISFNDNKRSMQVSGFYEYCIRNFYVNFIRKKESIKEENLELVKNKFEEELQPHQNNYTNLFKGKNVIFVQLESIDNFLVNDEIMPTLSSMRNNSINFTNHYSFVSGGGSTFNSEFMVNTGYTTPITINESAYTFSKNTYSYSMPNLFKKEGYTVNAFHMNNAEYYSRDVNYKAFGYDSYNSLKALNEYQNDEYYLDTQLIRNETFNNLIFNKEQKFAQYIITYSAHMPYEPMNGVCKLLNDDPTLKELDCLKLQARETDDMLKLLLENLEEHNMLDNTIIVAFADHYDYTLVDKSILDTYKNTKNNLINHTDFLIWSNNMKKVSIKEVTSQLNILPTIANLFGLEYHPNYYIGEDALDNSYQGIVFFSDYSWYDGNVYVENNVVTNGKYIDPIKLEEKNVLVSKLIKTNDTVLESDYFKKLIK